MAAQPRRRASASREIIVVVLVAVLCSWLLKTLVVQAFLIPSGSMENTLRVDDRIAVSKIGEGEIQRGDIVVFTDAGDWLRGESSGQNALARVVSKVGDFVAWLGLTATEEGHLVKRVIGLPGDHIRCCDAQGKLRINDVPLEEPYLFPGDQPGDDANGEGQFDIRVPADSYWVMGDHRSASSDSRAHRREPTTHGFVPASAVVGRAFAVVWPLRHARSLERPESFARFSPQP